MKQAFLVLKTFALLQCIACLCAVCRICARWIVCRGAALISPDNWAQIKTSARMLYAILLLIAHRSNTLGLLFAHIGLVLRQYSVICLIFPPVNCERCTRIHYNSPLIGFTTSLEAMIILAPALTCCQLYFAPLCLLWERMLCPGHQASDSPKATLSHPHKPPMLPEQTFRQCNIPPFPSDSHILSLLW